MVSPLKKTSPASEKAVLTKALLRATDRLGLTAKTLARVIGVSEASVSRMKSGELKLDPGTKPYELSILVIRLFRSLDAITGGDEKLARDWMNRHNTVLAGKPAEKITAISGLMNVIGYLDSRRARV